MSAATRIPLRNGVGDTIAYALVDSDQADAIAARWKRLPTGYVVRSVRRAGVYRTLYLHRVILGLDSGDLREADHVNGDRLDNRGANLRIVSRAENAQNRHYGYGTSRYRGVCWVKERGDWMASAKLNGQRHHLGYYASEKAAADAAAAWRAEHMPFSESDRKAA